MERIVLKASPGMVYTNGEIYGKEIYLGEGMSAEDFREVPEPKQAETQEV